MSTSAGRLPRTPSRAAGRAARRSFHSRRILPAVIAALLVTAAGVLVAVEAVSALTGSPARIVPYDRVTSWAAGTSWEEAAALTASAIVALLGLVFLVAGLWPGRGRLIPLRGDDPAFMVAITRRGLRGTAEQAAASVPGVTGVGRVKVGRRKVKVTADTAMREPGDLRARVESAVRERLDELGPLPRRGAAVRIRKPKD